MKTLLERTRMFLRDIGGEIAKVSWPPLPESYRATQAVLLVTAVSMVILVTVGAIAKFVFEKILYPT